MSGFGKYGIGAFGSGLIQGYMGGKELRMKEAAAKSRQELIKLEKPALELQAGQARRRAALLGIDLNAQGKDQGKAQDKASPTGSGQSGGTQVTPASSAKAAEHLRQLADQAVMDNLPEDATKYYALANQVDKFNFDHQLNQAMRQALASNSPQPLAKFFDAQMPGHTATFEKGKDGSYTVSIWNPDKSLASKNTYKNLDGVISAAMELASPQAYAAIQAGKLKDRLAILNARSTEQRAAAAQTSAEAATRRAAATETNAEANKRRADAEEERVHLLESGAGAKNLTDAAKWNRDLKLGRITAKQYAEHMQMASDKLTHQYITEGLSRYKAEYPQGMQPFSGAAAPPLDQYLKEYVKARESGKLSPDAKKTAKPLALPKSKAELKSDGTVYETAYGPATWDGKKFHIIAR